MKYLVLFIMCIISHSVFSQEQKDFTKEEFEKLKQRVYELEIRQSQTSSVNSSLAYNDQAGNRLIMSGVWYISGFAIGIAGSVILTSLALDEDPDYGKMTGVGVITGIAWVGTTALVTINLIEAGRALRLGKKNRSN